MPFVVKQSATGVLVRNSLFTLARLTANPKAKKLLPRLRPHHDHLKAMQAKANEAEDAVIFAEAAFAECELAATSLLTQGQLDLISDVGRDFQHPSYRLVFPKGLTGAKKMTGEHLYADMPRLLKAFGQLPQGSRARAHEKPLREVYKSWDAPNKALAQARLDQADAANAMLAAREKWFDAYDAMEGLLKAEFPRRKSLIDSFFRKPKNGKRAAAAPAQPGAATTAG